MDPSASSSSIIEQYRRYVAAAVDGNGKSGDGAQVLRKIDEMMELEARRQVEKANVSVSRSSASGARDLLYDTSILRYLSAQSMSRLGFYRAVAQGTGKELGELITAEDVDGAVDPSQPGLSIQLSQLQNHIAKRRGVVLPPNIAGDDDIIYNGVPVGNDMRYVGRRGMEEIKLQLKWQGTGQFGVDLAVSKLRQGGRVFTATALQRHTVSEITDILMTDEYASNFFAVLVVAIIKSVDDMGTDYHVIDRADNAYKEVRNDRPLLVRRALADFNSIQWNRAYDGFEPYRPTIDESISRALQQVYGSGYVINDARNDRRRQFSTRGNVLRSDWQ